MNRDPRGGGRGPQQDPPWKRRPRARGGKVLLNEGGTSTFLDDEIRAVSDLRTDRGRDKAGQYLVEGIRAVETLIDRARENVVAVYESEGLEWNRGLITKGPGRIPLRQVSAAEMEQISTTKTQQGLVAVAIASSLRVNWDSARRVTLVDSVQEPGNMGALFRTCSAFGFDAIVLGKGCVDAWNPRTVRGSAGLVACMPFEASVRLEQTLEFLRNKGFVIIGTTPHGKETIESVQLKHKVAILVGNEGKGASSNLLDQCDARVRIPMASGVESLNVSIAHGILAAGLFARG